MSKRKESDEHLKKGLNTVGNCSTYLGCATTIINANCVMVEIGVGMFLDIDVGNGHPMVIANMQNLYES